VITRATSKRRGESGFTIVEMVVAAAVFLVVMGAVYAFLRVGTSERFVANQRIESIQNVRIALNQIGREVLDAGVDYYPNGALVPDDTIEDLLGFPADGDSAPDYFLPVLPRDGVDTNALSGARTDRLTITYGNDTFGFRFAGPDGSLDTADDIVSSYIPVDQISGTTNFRVYSTTQTPYTNGACASGGMYLVTETGTSPRQAIGMCTALSGSNTVVFGNDPNNLNQPSSGGILKALVVSTSTPARLTPLVMVTYLVAPDGTLYRRLYGNYTASGNATAGTGVTATASTWLDEPVAFGVEDFQLQYLLEDGTVTASPPISQCNAIRQVQISITARSPERDPRSGEPFRTTLVATFNARNLAYSSR
jgi:prepilin-type N-terminal cleavage/methylation domain-containing protein